MSRGAEGYSGKAPSATGPSYFRQVSARVTPENRQLAPSVRFETNRLHSDAPVAWRFRQPEASLFWWETGFTRYDLDVDGGKTQADTASRRPFGLIPPGAEIRGEHHIKPDCTYHILFIDPAFLELRGKSLLGEPLIGFSDTALERSIRELSQWRDDATFSLMAEGWALQAVARIRARLDAEPSNGYASGGLTPAAFRRVQDYVCARLHESIGLIELATLAGLSVRQFSRAFRATTGRSPARFVHDRRLELAKTMLLRSDVKLTEIAFACGFSHAQHFSNSFHRAIGMTPSAFRRRALL